MVSPIPPPDSFKPVEKGRSKTPAEKTDEKIGLFARIKRIFNQKSTPPKPPSLSGRSSTLNTSPEEEEEEFEEIGEDEVKEAQVIEALAKCLAAKDITPKDREIYLHFNERGAFGTVIDQIVQEIAEPDRGKVLRLVFTLLQNTSDQKSINDVFKILDWIKTRQPGSDWLKGTLTDSALLAAVLCDIQLESEDEKVAQSMETLLGKVEPIKIFQALTILNVLSSNTLKKVSMKQAIDSAIDFTTEIGAAVKIIPAEMIAARLVPTSIKSADILALFQHVEDPSRILKYYESISRRFGSKIENIIKNALSINNEDLKEIFLEEIYRLREAPTEDLVKLFVEYINARSDLSKETLRTLFSLNPSGIGPSPEIENHVVALFAGVDSPEDRRAVQEAFTNIPKNELGDVLLAIQNSLSKVTGGRERSTLFRIASVMSEKDRNGLVPEIANLLSTPHAANSQTLFYTLLNKIPRGQVQSVIASIASLSNDLVLIQGLSIPENYRNEIKANLYLGSKEQVKIKQFLINNILSVSDENLKGEKPYKTTLSLIVDVAKMDMNETNLQNLTHISSLFNHFLGSFKLSPSFADRFTSFIQNAAASSEAEPQNLHILETVRRFLDGVNSVEDKRDTATLLLNSPISDLSRVLGALTNIREPHRHFYLRTLLSLTPKEREAILKDLGPQEFPRVKHRILTVTMLPEQNRTKDTETFVKTLFKRLNEDEIEHVINVLHILPSDERLNALKGINNQLNNHNQIMLKNNKQPEQYILYLLSLDKNLLISHIEDEIRQSKDDPVGQRILENLLKQLQLP